MRLWRDPKLPTGDDRGFALVTVLWIAGLLAVMTAALSVSVSTHVRVVANVTESAKAEALADAGAALAVLDLVAARGSAEHRRRFAADGQPVGCSIPGEGVLTIAVSDEAAKIDVNAAGACASGGSWCAGGKIGTAGGGDFRLSRRR
jgi:type II secretory pathway component PulK